MKLNCFETINKKDTKLGLTLSIEFIDKNERAISVRSEIGKETTFTITLKSAKVIF